MFFQSFLWRQKFYTFLQMLSFLRTIEGAIGVIFVTLEEMRRKDKLFFVIL